MTTKTFVRDPRVVAAAQAIAGVDSGRSRIKTPTATASAADYHEAVVALKAVDEVSSSAVAAVLALHTPVRRYQAASNTDKLTYPSPERALEQNRRHPMRGYESLVMAGVDDVPFIEVCAECSRVENASAETVSGPADDHDDEQDGTELSMNASAWPCTTYAALNSAVGTAPEASALRTIREVVERWENGALVDRGLYEGTVFVEPPPSLPPGLDEIREALTKAGIR